MTGIALVLVGSHFYRNMGGSWRGNYTEQSFLVLWLASMFRSLGLLLSYCGWDFDQQVTLIIYHTSQKYEEKLSCLFCLLLWFPWILFQGHLLASRLAEKMLAFTKGWNILSLSLKNVVLNPPHFFCCLRNLIMALKKRWTLLSRGWKMWIW